MYDVDLSYYQYVVFRNQHGNFITCVKDKIVVSQVLVTLAYSCFKIFEMEYKHIFFLPFSIASSPFLKRVCLAMKSINIGLRNQMNDEHRNVCC